MDRFQGSYNLLALLIDKKKVICKLTVDKKR